MSPFLKLPWGDGWALLYLGRRWASHVTHGACFACQRTINPETGLALRQLDYRTDLVGD